MPMSAINNFRSMIMVPFIAFGCIALPQIALANQNSVLTIALSPARLAVRPALLHAFGIVKARDEVRIDSRVSGLPVIYAQPRVGDVVHRGTVLVRFSTKSTRVKISLAKAALARAKADYADALIKQHRALLLHKEGMLSAQAILDIDTRAAVAEAALATADAKLRSARLALAHTTIVSPYSGVISSRTVSLGEVPSTGTELYRVIRNDTLQWEPQLTAAQLTRVRRGMAVTLDGPSGSFFKGFVREVSPALDPHTQTGLLYALLGRSPLLRAGTYLNGTILLGRRKVILVPSQSIVVRQGLSYAVTYKNGHALFIPVTVGHQGPNQTEVLSGLSAGAEMISQGAGLLNNGAPVSVAAAPR